MNVAGVLGSLGDRCLSLERRLGALSAASVRFLWQLGDVAVRDVADRPGNGDVLVWSAARERWVAGTGGGGGGGGGGSIMVSGDLFVSGGGGGLDPVEVWNVGSAGSAGGPGDAVVTVAASGIYHATMWWEGGTPDRVAMWAGGVDTPLDATPDPVPWPTVCISQYVQWAGGTETAQTMTGTFAVPAGGTIQVNAYTAGSDFVINGSVEVHLVRECFVQAGNCGG